MKRFFNILLGALAMIVVAIVSAFVAMRLAIHGREVEVPNLAGLTGTEAAARASDLGLTLSLENRFYSTAVPAGHIITQSPLPGSLVRRDGQVRVAESLGGQHVTIPDLVGQSERAASVILRRLSLELGAVSHVPSPSPEGTVIAQTPGAKSVNADSPRVSLIVASPLPEAEPVAYVMPTLTGLTVGTANMRLATAGLHISGAQDSSVAAPVATPSAVPTIDGTGPSPNAPLSSNPAVAFSLAPRQAPASYVIVSQMPAAGHRLLKTDTIHVSAVPRTPSATP